MKLTTINFSGDEMPILCTISALEKIQTEFGSIKNFLEKVMPQDGELPDIHAIAYMLVAFIDEGIEVYNENHNIKIEKQAPEKLFRKLDMPILDVSAVLLKEFWRSFHAPKQQPHTETNQN